MFTDFQTARERLSKETLLNKLQIYIRSHATFKLIT